MSLHATTVRNTQSRGQATVEPVRRVRADGADWCILERWREQLLGPNAPDWFALAGEPRAELVKLGHGRAVWRVTLAKETVYVKVATCERLLDRAKWLLLGSPGEREWRAAREAESRHVPVVRSLAVGVRGGRRPRSALVTEGLADAVTLPMAWEVQVARQAWHRRRVQALSLIDAIARLFAVSHDRAFEHRDGHPHNILVARRPTGPSTVCFVDIHSSHLGGQPVSRKRGMRQLAQLDQYFHRCATRTERLRFVRSYLGHRQATEGRLDDRMVLREFLTGVTIATQTHRERLAQQRDRRLRRDGKYFATMRWEGGWWARVVLEVERRHVFPEADVPNRTVAEWRAILKPVSEAINNGGSVEGTGNRHLNVEVSHPRGLSERLSWTWGGSPQHQAFERCHRNRHRDDYAELILAYAQRRQAGLVDTTFLLRPHRPAT